jgi:hypothetical protein
MKFSDNPIPFVTDTEKIIQIDERKGKREDEYRERSQKRQHA